MDAQANRFWEGFTPRNKKRLLASMAVENYPDRGFLFREGDPADGVCLVLSGRVEVFRMAGGQEQTLGHFAENEFLGEVAVIDGAGRSTCARATGPVTIGKLPKELVLEILLEEPALVSLRLFQQVLSYLRHTNDLFMEEAVDRQKLTVVGNMAGSLMHDLRNPLTGIRLAADLISLKHGGDAEIMRCCDGIRFQCDRVMAMTCDLLQYSTGDSALEIQRTTTSAFLDRFRSLHQDYVHQAGIALEILAEPAEIEIDEMRCLRLLQNLTTNAVEALSEHAGGRIRVRGWVEKDMFNLSVVDNGPGIPAAIRDRVFQPFVTHGKKGGIGLGMAIVSNVVTAHHGRITLETSERGTCFHAQLPQYALPENRPAAPAQSPALK